MLHILLGVILVRSWLLKVIGAMGQNIFLLRIIMVKDCNLVFTLIIFYKYHVLYGFEITWIMHCKDY
jgi:hypothetical protein